MHRLHHLHLLQSLDHLIQLVQVLHSHGKMAGHHFVFVRAGVGGNNIGAAFADGCGHIGHAAGDQALVHAIEIIRGVIRESDVLARFGGEEFILLLPHTARDGALSLSARILNEVRRTPIDLPEAKLRITLSAGSVTCETSETPLDLMMSRADELLYKSKQQGRDRCTAETLLNLAKRTVHA